MGEKERERFQFTFNGFLKVEFQGSRVTSDAGLVLVRELDERLGLAKVITEHLSDSRHGLNTQFGLAALLRQSVYSRLAGYEDLNDAERLATDPALRLIGSPKLWDRGAALTSTLHWFETDLLTREENLVGLMAVNRDVLAQAELHEGADRLVLDMDSSESPCMGSKKERLQRALRVRLLPPTLSVQRPRRLSGRETASRQRRERRRLGRAARPRTRASAGGRQARRLSR